MSLLCILCLHSCAPEKIYKSITHPNNSPSQARLLEVLSRQASKKMHLIGMDILLILLSFKPEYHHYRGQNITIHPPSDVLVGQPQFRNLPS
jgi:hypothetical protein